MEGCTKVSVNSVEKLEGAKLNVDIPCGSSITLNYLIKENSLIRYLDLLDLIREYSFIR